MPKSKKLTKRPIGKPPAFNSPEELEEKIQEYFDYCDNRIKEIHDKEGGVIAVTVPAPYTMSGLANRLGVDRDTILNYSKKDAYFGTIKAAKNRVQEDVEERLMEGKNQAGAIFNLKNNFGWKDKTEQETTHILPKPILELDVPADDSNQED